MLKKIIFSVLAVGLVLAQELEVEGDLKVTGTVESATIDSLEQVIANMQADMYEHIETMNTYHLSEIADLQAQIDSMHVDNMLETRFYQLPRINFTWGYEYYLDLLEITGYTLDYAQLYIVKVNDFSIEENLSVSCNLGYDFFDSVDNNYLFTYTYLELYNNGNVRYNTEYIIYDNAYQMKIRFGDPQSEEGIASGYIDLTLAITAQFPD
jgi:hypothetical protein